MVKLRYNVLSKNLSFLGGAGGERVILLSNLAPCLACFVNQTVQRIGLQTEAPLFQTILHKHHLLLGR